MTGNADRIEPDKIELRGLIARTIIGVLEHERQDRQDVVIDLTLTIDAASAAATDRIEDAIDYAAVTDRTLAYVASTSFSLIETLAENIAATLLSEFSIAAVSVRLEKPDALAGSATVAITITRP